VLPVQNFMFGRIETTKKLLLHAAENSHKNNVENNGKNQNILEFSGFSACSSDFRQGKSRNRERWIKFTLIQIIFSLQQWLRNGEIYLKVSYSFINTRA